MLTLLGAGSGALGCGQACVGRAGGSALRWRGSHRGAVAQGSKREGS